MTSTFDLYYKSFRDRHSNSINQLATIVLSPIAVFGLMGLLNFLKAIPPFSYIPLFYPDILLIGAAAKSYITAEPVSGVATTVWFILADILAKLQWWTNGGHSSVYLFIYFLLYVAIAGGLQVAAHIYLEKKPLDAKYLSPQLLFDPLCSTFEALGFLGYNKASFNKVHQTFLERLNLWGKKAK